MTRNHITLTKTQLSRDELINLCAGNENDTSRHATQLCPTFKTHISIKQYIHMKENMCALKVYTEEPIRIHYRFITQERDKCWKSVVSALETKYFQTKEKRSIALQFNTIGADAKKAQNNARMLFRRETGEDDYICYVVRKPHRFATTTKILN